MLDLKSLVPWGQKSERALTAHNDRHDPFTSFRREIDRVFDDFFDTAFGPVGRRRNGLDGLTPSLDVAETENAIVVTAELAGVDESDLDVTLTGDVLTIKGEKKTQAEDEKGGRQYVERRYGAFSRSMRLPFEAGDQDVEANMKNGILTVRITKPAEVQDKTKRIEVRAA